MKEGMALSFEFLLMNTEEKDEVFLRKFHQVIFLSPDRNEIDIFTCIVCGGKAGLKLKVTTAATTQSADVEKVTRIDKLPAFRKEPEPWRLYWGDSPTKPAKTQSVNQGEVSSYVSTYRSQCDKTKCEPHIKDHSFEQFFYNNEEKIVDETNGGYMILPGDGDYEPNPLRMFSLCLPAHVEEDGTDALDDADSGHRCRFNYQISRKERQQYLADVGVDVIDWTHLKVPNVRWASIRRAYPMSVSWEFVNRVNGNATNGIEYRIDDFKVYFVVGEGHEIDTDEARVTGSITGAEEVRHWNPFDRMTRQPRAYFDEWTESFDIGSSTVYRLRGKPIDLIGGVSYGRVEVAFKLGERGFSQKQLVAAFALPFVAAIGLDTTRLASAMLALSSICNVGPSLTGCYFAEFPYAVGVNRTSMALMFYPSVAFMVGTFLVSALLLIHAFGSARTSNTTQTRVGGGAGDLSSATKDDRTEKMPLMITLGSRVAFLFYAVWITCIVAAADIGSVGQFTSYFSGFLTNILALTKLFWQVAVSSASITLLLIFRKRHLFPMWGLRKTNPSLVLAIKIIMFAIAILVWVPDAVYLFESSYSMAVVDPPNGEIDPDTMPRS